MKKKITGIILATLALLLMTSCQHIDQAIEDTFRPLPQKQATVDKSNQGFLERVEDFFMEDGFFETGIDPNLFDIRDDIFVKLELADPLSDFDFFVIDYINKNEIDKYLTLEEAQDLLDLFHSQNLLLNPERTIQVLQDLPKDLGSDKIYVYNGRITIYNDTINLQLHKPENANHVDSYTYDVDADEWRSQAMRNLNSENPLAKSVLITDLPLQALYKVTEASLDTLKEIGEYNQDFPYENASTFKGIQSITLSLSWKDGDYIVGIESTVRGERDYISLKFDSDGNLLTDDLFMDGASVETGTKLPISDIEENIYAKLELEDPLLDFKHFVRDYIGKNEIEDYLSLEEAQDLLDLFHSQNLILNPERAIQALEDLSKDLGWDKVYVYLGSVNIYKDHIDLVLHTPENHNHIDSYTYDIDKDEWSVFPLQNLNSQSPLAKSVLITDIPLQALHKVTEASLDALKEIGEFNEDFPYENASTFKGVQSIAIFLDWKAGNHSLGIKSIVKGERDLITLIFDSDGNLIEKQR